MPETSAADPVRWRRLDDHVITGDGLYLRIDEADSLGLMHRAYEPFETAILMRLARPGTVVLDVGANVGYHTVQFARAVGPSGRVVAFEPDPDHVRILRHNVRTNGFRQVDVVPCAASDATGPLLLYRSPDNLGDHRVYDSGDGREAVAIDAVAIDDVLGACRSPISIIKMDVQGSEPRALRGMRRVLAAHPEAWLATEFWPGGLRRAGSSADEYLAALEALGGGRLLRVDERRARLVPLDRAWLAETVTLERDNHTNVLVPRREWDR